MTSYLVVYLVVFAAGAAAFMGIWLTDGDSIWAKLFFLMPIWPIALIVGLASLIWAMALSALEGD